jgi:hypothetical protein
LEDFSTFVFRYDACERSALAKIAHFLTVFDQTLLKLWNRMAEKLLPLPCPSMIYWPLNCEPPTDALLCFSHKPRVQPFGHQPM